MKTLILCAGALALGIAAPALAKPGNGHGNGHGKAGQANAYVYGQNGYANPYAYGQNGPVGYGVGGCPPGLAKKNNGCMPPGQAKKQQQRLQQQYAVGQQLPQGMFSPYAYNRIPYDIRNQYGLDPYNRYYYDNGNLYGVDPRTMLIEQVIGALIR